jgi:hypothetical protein
VIYQFLKPPCDEECLSLSLIHLLLPPSLSSLISDISHLLDTSDVAQGNPDEKLEGEEVSVVDEPTAVIDFEDKESDSFSLRDKYEKETANRMVLLFFSFGSIDKLHRGRFSRC